MMATRSRFAGLLSFPDICRGLSMGRRVFLAAVCFLALLLAATGRLGAAEMQTLEIASKSGVHAFAVELALTPDEQSRGLMYRRSLPEGQGMLFDFKRDQET